MHVIAKSICRVTIGLLALALGVSRSLSENAPSHQPIEYVKAGDCSPCDRMAVIFVHGIGGSSTTTWTNGDVYWPKLLADDPDIGSKIDVYALNYDSSLLWSRGSIVDIMKRIDRELDDLFYKRRYQKIAMICHSMGGIVCGSYLLHVKARYGHRVLAKFRLIFGMAVPHEGSDYARLLSMLDLSAQTRILAPIKQNDFLQLLNLTTTAFLAKQHEQNCPELSTYAGYEKLPLQSYPHVPHAVIARLNLTIVSQESAILGANKSRGFDRDHLTLVEPAGPTDEVYVWVRDNLKNCIDGTEVCVGSLHDANYSQCGTPLTEFPEPSLLPVDPTDDLFRH